MHSKLETAQWWAGGRQQGWQQRGRQEKRARVWMHPQLPVLVFHSEKGNTNQFLR